MPLPSFLYIHDFRAFSQYKAYLNYFQTTDADTRKSRLTNGSKSAGGTDAVAGGSKKRPVTLHSQESEPRKRKDTRSDHERRLTGDYAAPADARPIVFKQPSSDDTETQSGGRPMATKHGARSSHRPVNTLGKPSPQATNTRNAAHPGFFTGYANKKEIRKPEQIPQHGQADEEAHFSFVSHHFDWRRF